MYSYRLESVILNEDGSFADGQEPGRYSLSVPDNHDGWRLLHMSTTVNEKRLYITTTWSRYSAREDANIKPSEDSLAG